MVMMILCQAWCVWKWSCHLTAHNNALKLLQIVGRICSASRKIQMAWEVRHVLNSERVAVQDHMQQLIAQGPAAQHCKQKGIHMAGSNSVNTVMCLAAYVLCCPSNVCLRACLRDWLVRQPAQTHAQTTWVALLADCATSRGTGGTTSNPAKSSEVHQRFEQQRGQDTSGEALEDDHQRALY